MRNILPFVMVLMLFASLVPAAAAGIPGDTDGNEELTENELASNILNYIHEKGDLNLNELRDGAHVYAYWNGNPRTIIDSANRTVTIYKPIKGIVVLNSDAGEAVKILGVSNKVVGIVDTIQEKPFYFPEMSEKTVVGTWEEIRWEKIVDLYSKSDSILVITYTKYGAKVDIAEEKLDPFAIPVAGLDLYNPSLIPTELTNLSVLLESEEKASLYIGWCDEHKILVDVAVSGKEKPKVFMTKSKAMGVTSDIPTFGQGTTDDELCEMTGGINIASNLTTKYPKVSAEWVLRENPDIIIMKIGHIDGWDNETKPKSLIEDLLEGKGWDNVNAVKNNNVYVVPHSTIYGMEQPYGLALFAKIFHPEVDINPSGVYKEFLEEFIGIEYPENMVFVYPAV